ncbi:MAG: 50S ribosomal protein L4 [Firmicutes bacterium]|nr:50S ribosomal protein L4 [Bacillota bacterium]MBO2520861.1 50S ribosomal protein L4 [Bacillota bacterium]
MPKVAVYNMKGEQVGDLELSETVFGAPVNEGLVHQAVVRYLANQRQGTASTKTRGEVSGGGRKPWRQKGTGRARQGSIRAPQWVGGGTVFGPKPRDYRQAMPKKARRAALRSALSSKVASGELLVLDELTFEEPKTKKMVEVLQNLKAAGASALVVTGELDRNVILSARNIPGVGTTRAGDLNVYDVVAHARLIATKDAIAKIEEVLG